MTPTSEAGPAAALLARFTRAMGRLALGARPLLVAVSGGLDSTVLLDLAVRWREAGGAGAPALLVAHVDHGIHPASGEVARRVARLAGAHRLRLVGVRLELGAGASETCARQARLAWLREARRRTGAGWILTAHHADDQRETVLMRLLHGSGPAGLAGMSARGREVARPLLGMSRSELRAYAEAQRLSWWEDPANEDARHFRSWVRTALLPAAAAREPRGLARLDEAARHAARDRRAWGEAVREWPGLGFRQEGGVVSLDWTALGALPRALQGALAGALVRAAGTAVGPRAVHRALRTLNGGASGSRADLTGGWQLGLAFGRLEVLAPARNADAGVRLVEGAAGEEQWGEWTIRWRAEPAPPEQPRDGGTAWFIPGTLMVRGWRPGDRLAPLRGRGHRLAAQCFQEARIAAPRRKTWPVVTDPEAGELAWIPGVCRSATRVPAAGTPALRVEVAPRA